MEDNNYPLFFDPQHLHSINNSTNLVMSHPQTYGNMYGNGAAPCPNHQKFLKNEEDVTSYNIEAENSNNSNEKDENKKANKGVKKVKRQRFAFQTRSQVDILDDGYRWRKYGQKAVKNNNFPRSYYRCTHQGCNVKKQVQRLSKDEGVVVTTYEGVHTHPIQKSNDNFEHILNQMQIYSAF